MQSDTPLYANMPYCILLITFAITSARNLTEINAASQNQAQYPSVNVFLASEQLSDIEVFEWKTTFAIYCETSKYSFKPALFFIRLAPKQLEIAHRWWLL